MFPVNFWTNRELLEQNSDYDILRYPSDCPSDMLTVKRWQALLPEYIPEQNIHFKLSGFDVDSGESTNDSDGGDDSGDSWDSDSDDAGSDGYDDGDNDIDHVCQHVFRFRYLEI